MPKIIENLKTRLMAEAARQIEEAGYGAMTIRSVAKACGVGVGTVYNYFPSKDALLATCLLEDWTACIAAIEAVSTDSDCPEPVVRSICSQLCQYIDRHSNIFRDADAAASFSGSFGRYHTLLRQQLAAPLRKFCSDDFAAEFIAEALLTWNTAVKPVDEIFRMVRNLFSF